MGYTRREHLRRETVIDASMATWRSPALDLPFSAPLLHSRHNFLKIDVFTLYIICERFLPFREKIYNLDNKFGTRNASAVGAEVNFWSDF